MVLDVLFDFALTCMEATTKNGSSLRAVLHKPECEGHQQVIFPVADPEHKDVFLSEPIGANAVKRVGSMDTNQEPQHLRWLRLRKMLWATAPDPLRLFGGCGRTCCPTSG